MIVETERLRLRELTEADAPALLALYQHADVSRFMGPPPASLDIETANIRSHRAQYYTARGYGLWGVESREDGQLIGRCGLLDVTLRGRPEVELSYLIHPDRWGRGLATEAARAVVAYARVPLGLTRIVALIHPANTRSLHVAERLGMRPDGSVEYKTFGAVDLFVWTAPSP